MKGTKQRYEQGSSQLNIIQIKVIPDYLELNNKKYRIIRGPSCMLAYLETI